MRAVPTTSSSNAADDLRARLESKTAVVAVIGLGYVGLPLVRAAHDAGFRVLGYDIDPVKVVKLKKGETYLKHLGEELVKSLAASDRFEATDQSLRLREADVIVLCVPTPLGERREPDLSYVRNSTRMVARTLRKGQLVVLESTTYPGTTRGEMLPILEEAGLICGRDFFLGYSPEREDPGRKGLTTRAIPKLISGVDEVSTDAAMAFYSQFIEKPQRVSSAEVAEAAKLLENVFRAVNIALVNELKVLLDEMGIDVWEVIAAASTKPFGFMPFYPGPGLGGHCIPIDPFYLAWKAKEVGKTTKFIELAGEINANMPAYVVSRIASALNDERKSLKGSNILIIGIAYKPDVDDIRESPAAVIIELLRASGASVAYHDPHIARFPAMRKHDIDLDSVPLDESTLASQDCVVIVTNHRAIDYELVGRSAKCVVDTRNAMAAVRSPVARIVKA